MLRNTSGSAKNRSNWNQMRWQHWHAIRVRAILQQNYLGGEKEYRCRVYITPLKPVFMVEQFPVLNWSLTSPNNSMELSIHVKLLMMPCSDLSMMPSLLRSYVSKLFKSFILLYCFAYAAGYKTLAFKFHTLQFQKITRVFKSCIEPYAYVSTFHHVQFFSTTLSFWNIPI